MSTQQQHLTPSQVAFDIFSRDVADDVTVPEIASMRDMLGSMLYVQNGKCDRCYPATNYCRGHIGKIMFNFYHIRYIYRDAASLLCSLICDNCFKPVANSSSVLSMQKMRLLSTLYPIYGNSSCICTGATEAKDKPTHVQKLTKVYEHFQMLHVVDELHTLFRLGTAKQVIVKYVVVVPAKLLEQIPNGAAIMSCYARLLDGSGGANVEARDNIITELYEACVKATEGKPGIMRQYVLPRRVSNSSRAVIISDPRLGLCDVGIPQSMFRSLYSDVLVTAENIWSVVASVQRGLAFAVSYNNRRYKLISADVQMRVSGCTTQQETREHTREVVHGSRILATSSTISSHATHDTAATPATHATATPATPAIRETVTTYDGSNHAAFISNIGATSSIIEPDGTVVRLSLASVSMLYVSVSSSSALTQIDTSRHKLLLQIGCIVSMSAEGQKILMHRNPVLSAGSVRVHYMVPIVSPRSTYMTQLERYEQRVQLVRRQYKTLLGVSDTLAAAYVSDRDAIIGERLPTHAKNPIMRYSIISSDERCIDRDVDTSCCISLNPIAVTTYQGDFDGDEMNAFSLNSCNIGDTDMTLIGDLLKGTFGPIHDAMYGLYLLTHDLTSPQQLLSISTPMENVTDFVLCLFAADDKLSIKNHRTFNEFFCKYVMRDDVKVKLVEYYRGSLRMCLQRFYADIQSTLCYLCDRKGLYFDLTNEHSIDTIIDSSCKPKASTRDTIYRKIGRTSYVLPSCVRISTVASNYGEGVTEAEYVELCYSHRLQAANKALSTAPEGENMRLQCSYMSNLQSNGNMWYCEDAKRLLYEELTDAAIMCSREDELLSEDRVYCEIVDDNSRRLPYRKPSELPMHILEHKQKIQHMGQRKLLMAEVDFLTDYASTGNPLVVYAGAAGGSHINVLLQLFTNVEFHLYDVADFSSVLFNKISNKPRERISIFREYLTQQTASRYFSTTRHVLLISDIRNNSNHPNKPTDADISRDNATNVEILEQMQPFACMLKFRLPYADGESVLPDGERRLQCWCGVESTEVRLVAARPYTLRAYDHRTHEQVMYCHNLQRPYPIPSRTVSSRLLVSIGCNDENRYYDMYREQSIVEKLISNKHITEAQVYAHVNDSLGDSRRRLQQPVNDDVL